MTPSLPPPKDERNRLSPAQELSLLQAVLDSVEEGLLVVDTAGRIVRFNRRFADLWRLPDKVLSAGVDEQAIAFVLDQLLDPEAFLAKVRELYALPEAVSEDILHFKDRRVFERTSRPHRVDGLPAGRIWSFRDVTRRYRGEIARNAAFSISLAVHSAAGLSDLVRSIHNAILELMPAENFYIALYDRGSDTISFPYFVDPLEDPPPPSRSGRGLTEYVLRTGEPLLASPEVFDALVARGEVEEVGPSSVDWLGVPLVSDGATIGALVVQSYTAGIRYRPEDLDLLVFVSSQVALVIRRKLADDALRERETRLSLLLAQFPAVLWTTDRELRYTSTDGSALATVGLQPGDGVGTSVYDFFDSTDPALPAIAAHLRALGGQAGSYENLWSGHVYSSHVEPLRAAEGAIIGTIGVAIDVSERKALEEELRQSQKLEAIGRLAGGVAHDFNNLLTSILGGSSLILERLGADVTVRAEVEKIQSAAERAASLTQQLLAFSRRQVVEPRVLDLNALAAHTAKMLERLLGEEIRLQLSFDPASGPVRADEGQISQVLINLAVNARDSMPASGTIRIATSTLVIANTGPGIGLLSGVEIPAGRYCVLTVSDDGVGMDAETLSHIFEPFFTTKKKGKGTGLGLATVYGIVTQSGGFITAESLVGRGSTFRILLPAMPVNVAPLSTTREPEGTDGRGETILIVEDEAAVRELVATALRHRGYRILTAANAEEALLIERQHEGPIDLLITDVVMQGQRGPELARRICERRPALHVLFMSGYPDDALGEHGVLDTGTAFLQKPFKVSTLGAKVAEVLRSPA